MGQEEVIQFLTAHKGEPFSASHISQEIQSNNKNIHDTLWRLEKSKQIYSYYTTEKGRLLKLYYLDEQPKKSTFSEVFQEYNAIREMHRSVPAEVVATLMLISEIRKKG